MGKTTLIVRIDEDTKEEARQLAIDVGLTLSNLVNIQLKQVIRTREIKIEAPRKDQAELEAEAIRSAARAKVRQQPTKPFQTVKEALGSLKTEETNKDD